MGILLKMLGLETSEETKRKKFKELENTYAGDPDMVSFAKASWLTSRGCSYGKQQKYDNAVKDFKEAIALKADYSQAYVGWGTALIESGKLDEALDVLLNASIQSVICGQEYSAVFEISNRLAVVYFLKGDMDNFVAEAKKAIDAAGHPKRKEEIAFAIECGAVGRDYRNDDDIVKMLQEKIKEIENNKDRIGGEVHPIASNMACSAEQADESEAESIRNTMREAYQRDYTRAVKDPVGDEPPMYFGLFGAMASRHMARAQLDDVEIVREDLERVVWLDVSPFLLMKEADAIEVLAEYIVYQECGSSSRIRWLKEMINGAIRNAPMKNESPRAMVVHNFANRLTLWTSLLEPDVIRILENDVKAL